MEFATRRKDGLILYNGPITAPEEDQPVVSGWSVCVGVRVCQKELFVSVIVSVIFRAEASIVYFSCHFSKAL